MTTKRISIDLTLEEMAAADAIATLNNTNRKNWIENLVHEAIQQRITEYLETFKKQNQTTHLT